MVDEHGDLPVRSGFDQDGVDRERTEKERAEIEKARKEQQAALAEMKARLPPEQYEQMAQAMNAGMQAMFTSYEQVPPANLALLKKHRQEIAAIVNR